MFLHFYQKEIPHLSLGWKVRYFILSAIVPKLLELQSDDLYRCEMERLLV